MYSLIKRSLCTYNAAQVLRHHTRGCSAGAVACSVGVAADGPEAAGVGFLDRARRVWVRTVTVPAAVKARTDLWTVTAKITDGPLFRAVSKGGEVQGRALQHEKAVWRIVARYARETELGKVAPHDLRRTCAKLCRKAGGDLEQIQLLLGHASVQTTERYLGTEQNLVEAVNGQ